MKAYGWRPDPAHVVASAPRASDRLRAEPPPPPAVDLTPFGIRIVQRRQGSCGAHALAEGIYVWCHARGIDAPLVSRRFVYKVSRAIDGSRGDTGIYPSSGFRALSLVGAPAEPVYEYDGDNVDPAYLDELPPQSVYREASDLARKIQAHRIFETDDLRGLLVRQALAAKLPVLIGLQIDQAFEDAGPGTVIDAPDPLKLVGGHALSLLGYRTNAAGKFEYLIRNWWDVEWGDRGDCWITEAFLNAATDVWVHDHADVPEAA